jgi:hypothetical protein
MIKIMHPGLAQCLAILAVAFALSTQLFAAPAVTTTKLTVFPSGPISVDTVVTFVATVESGEPVGPGIVYFCSSPIPACFTGSGLYGKAQLSRTGTAMIRIRLNVGNNNIVAVFMSTKKSLGSSSAEALVAVDAIAVYPSVTSLASAGGPGNYTLMGDVSVFGKEPLSGTVSFLDTSDNDIEIGSATLFDPSIGLSKTVPYGVGHQPTSVATADFNDDGIPDLVVANENDNTVSVCLGNGDGTFQKGITTGTGHTPESIAVGDFNGDDIPDIAVANTNANSITILLGNGDGSFQSKGTLTSFLSPVSIAAGDFDDDGNLDLVVCNTFGGDVSVLLGNGDGTFQSAKIFDTGIGPQSVAVGDFNLDGIVDLVVANSHEDTASVLLGNGDGTFQPQTKLTTGNSAYSVATADLNNDGILDVAVANRNSNTVSIILGNGNGTFQNQVFLATGTAPSAVAVGDFNGDGIPDLAVADETDSDVSIFLGKGNGAFSSRQTYMMKSFTGSLAVGDFNGDGLTDLANTDLVELNVQLGEQIANFSASGISGLGSSTNWVLADYPGDNIRTASQSATVPLGGVPGTPTVLLFSAPNPASFGTVVTLSATVTGGDLVTPTGEVIFKDDTTVLGAATISGTAATIATNNLSVGIHHITANYNGDYNYNAANSFALFQTITKAPAAIVLTSSINPSVYGDVLTLTATLTRRATGTVTFMDGKTAIGSNTVSSTGSATISTSALTAGLHSITAIYSGDENFQ